MEWVVEPYKGNDELEKAFEAGNLVVNRGGSWGYPGIDQYTFSRFFFPRTGALSKWHDIGCRLGRDV